MPLKLSALDGITDGISGALHSTVDTGTSTLLPSFLHDGVPGQLVSATLDGSLAPIIAAAALLAAGGVHILRTRPLLTLRTLPV
ncbi:MAG: hypothetical protein ACJ71Y_10110 [Blastococcus sp.]